jgi:plasmid stability protein
LNFSSPRFTSADRSIGHLEFCPSGAIMIARRIDVAQVIVRKLEESVKRKLKQRAARHGHSMEQEIRDILRNAVKDERRPRKGLGTEIVELFKGIGLEESIKELRGYRVGKRVQSWLK